jgi:hypothetical protein
MGKASKATDVQSGITRAQTPSGLGRDGPKASEISRSELLNFRSGLRAESQEASASHASFHEIGVFPPLGPLLFFQSRP